MDILNALSLVIPVGAGVLAIFFRNFLIPLLLLALSVSCSWWIIFYIYQNSDPANSNGSVGAFTSVLGWVPSLIVFIIIYFVGKFFLLAMRKMTKTNQSPTSK